MNLSKLTHKVWEKSKEDGLNIRKRDVGIIIKIMLDEIVNSVLTAGKVKLHNVFSLELRKNKGRRIGRPNTDEHMYIDDYHKVSIIPSKALKEKLKDLDKN